MEMDEDKMYEQLQKQHGQLLENREKEKYVEMRRKINMEKESRDRQMKEEQHRKKMESRE